MAIIVKVQLLDTWDQQDKPKTVITFIDKYHGEPTEGSIAYGAVAVNDQYQAAKDYIQGCGIPLDYRILIIDTQCPEHTHQTKEFINE